MLRIVVDTREKEEYVFTHPVVHKKLPAGDYSIETMEDRIVIERKSLEDFVQTVIRGRERFKKELLKLQGCDFACVVVEASLMDVLNGSFRSDAHPKSVLGSALSIIADYRIPVFFCTNRQAARLFVEELLLKLSGKVDALCLQHTKKPHQS